MNKAAVICLAVMGFVYGRPSPSPAAAGEGAAYSALSARIAAYARANGIKKLVVADFAARGGASAPEAEYASEKMSALLGGAAAPILVERDYIKKIMTELRASTAAAGSPYGEKMRQELGSVDAVVAGSVFAGGETVKVLVRLLDARSGTVLFSAEADTKREWPESQAARAPLPPRSGVYSLTAELPGVFVPGFPAGAVAAAPPAPPSDLRDSVSDFPAASCAARRQRLGRSNEELVDAKARYWAVKMQAPGFLPPGLRETPGAEIDAPETRARFYALLGAYYKSRPAAPPGAAELVRVIGLLEAEALFTAECPAP